MKTKKYFAFLVCLFLMLSSKAQLLFKNNTDEPVAVAIAKYNGNSQYGNWTTFGWTRVDPGDLVTVADNIGLNDKCFYYAENINNSGVRYQGKVNFLVDRNNSDFNIKNSDKQYQKDENPDYTWVKFREFVYDTDFLGETKFKQIIVLDY
jgi:uncharacterized membrane protein